MDETATRFWSVWHAQHRKLYEMSLRRTGGHRADAEDVLGTAMLRALEAFPRQEHRLTHVEAWLARILHNTCMDLHRARRRQDAVPLPEDEGPGAGRELPSPAPSAEQVLLEEEQSTLLWRHVAALPESLRRPYLLRFEQGLASPDIGQRLGLTAVNVRRRLTVAHRRLRVALGVRSARDR